MHKKNNRISSLQSKAYFHIPGCEEYYKAKYKNYEKVKKMRSNKVLDKQNIPALYEFQKPRSGYYLLKGCNMKLKTNQPMENKSDSNNNGQLLKNFLQKFIKRKQRQFIQQSQQSSLPNIKSLNYKNQLYNNLNCHKNPVKSVFMESRCYKPKKICPKLKTQPDTNHIQQYKQIKSVKGSLPIALIKSKIKSHKVLHTKSLSKEKDTI